MPGGPVGTDELVPSRLLGDRVPHLHVHLLPRYPGTPQEFRGLNADEWPGAERGTEPQIAGLVPASAHTWPTIRDHDIGVAGMTHAKSEHQPDQGTRQLVIEWTTGLGDPEA